jgi:mRNA interferase MazF
MRRAGQIGLLEFPQTDFAQGKRRPVLLLAEVPGPHADWWICMFSTQLEQAIPGFDEMVRAEDADFAGSGLRTESVIRVARVAVVESARLIGAIGSIAPDRLARIRRRLADWLSATT